MRRAGAVVQSPLWCTQLRQRKGVRWIEIPHFVRQVVTLPGRAHIRTSVRTPACCHSVHTLLAVITKRKVSGQYRISLVQHFSNCFVKKNRETTKITASWYTYAPIPVAARSKALVCGRSHDGIVGVGGVDVCLLWVLCVVRRGVCDEPITRPEESYRCGCTVLGRSATGILFWVSSILYLMFEDGQ
jgi:hypothetical protein